jgi:hypothetical protein
MITIETLKKFCATENARPILTAPFSFGAYTYATDRKICIRVPRIAEVTEENDITQRLPWDQDEIAGWQDMPSGYMVPPRVVCRSCMGSKKFQPCLDCEFLEGCQEDPTEALDCERIQEIGNPCTMCDATGTVFQKPYFRVPMRSGGTDLNGEYLEKLRVLPGMIWLAPDPADPLCACVRIRSSAGWDGMLMPMRPKESMQ